MKKRIYIFLFYSIFAVGAALRLYSVNWDNNFHMHPDERAIILTVLDLHFPTSLAEFLSPQSAWNPAFFAYGSFPFYLLKTASSFNTIFQTYDGLTILGRYMSAFFDLGTLFLIFLIGKKIRNLELGLIAAFFYSISTLSIQLSHFYAVDTPLTFFITLCLYFLIHPTSHKSIVSQVLVGISFAFAISTKISAILLIVPILISIVYQLKKSTHASHNALWFFQKLILRSVWIFATTAIVFFLLSPYTLIDFASYWTQTLQQQAMTRDPFTFPYTLQYVGKIPYVYELKNIFLFGLGIPLVTICFLGTIVYTVKLLTKRLKEHPALTILLSFIWIYFLVVGNFAIGFVRYMLPIYPLLCLFGACLIYAIVDSNKKTVFQHSFIPIAILLLAILLIWPLSFSQIYTRSNTRIQATDWITRNIQAGSTIAIEHWDDAIPIHDQENYKIITLPLYDQDTPEKWIMINNQLSATEYIILASNRLYTPLQKLTKCSELPVGRCYLLSSNYYKKLFNGELGFKKIAEFTSFPTIPFVNIQIDDQAADESFTVYDHPKVIIFKKDRSFPSTFQ